MKYLSRLVFIPVAIVVVIFAVANREPVKLNLWPLPYDMVIPLFIAVLGALGTGALIGGAVVWFGVVKWRFRARAGDRRARALERELAVVRPSESARSTPPAVTGRPGGV